MFMFRELHHNSYDQGYGGDAYLEEPSSAYARKSSPAKRYKRSVQEEMGVREDQVLVPFGGKIGKKLGKILHNPVLKKVSKRSAKDEGEAREGEAAPPPFRRSEAAMAEGRHAFRALADHEEHVRQPPPHRLRRAGQEGPRGEQTGHPGQELRPQAAAQGQAPQGLQSGEHAGPHINGVY